MISYKDIKTAVNIQLKKTGLKVNNNDTTEGFTRPSFFVQIDNAIRFSTESQVQREMTIYIHYFPTCKEINSTELLEMQDTLEELFDMKLKLKDRLLNINDFSSDVRDGVLICNFDLEFWYMKDSYLIEQEDAEKMEILDINIIKE